jgi:hypothetical protein
VVLIFLSLENLAQRLKSIEWVLDGTKFAWNWEVIGQIKAIRIVEPNGNIFIAEEEDARAPEILSSFGSHSSGFGNVLGIRSIIFDCDIGTSCEIANFYHEIFGARTEKDKVTQYGSLIDKNRDSDKGKSCVIHAELPGLPKNLCQTIVYRETSRARPRNAYDVYPSLCGFHLCIYVQRYDYSTGLAHSKDLIWVNKRFAGPPFFDTVSTDIQALQTQQYRMKDIINLSPEANREVLFVLEHEVRGMGHEQCPLIKSKL